MSGGRVDNGAASRGFDLDGRAVWITGASRGLGLSLAHAFAGAGAALLLTARSEPLLAELAAKLGEEGCDVATVIGSVNDVDVLGRCVETIEERWGGLDALVNNAGIGGSFVRAEQADLDEVRSVLETNLVAPLECSRRALPLLKSKGGGSIVNVSSVHGSVAGPRAIAYAMSKGGLELMTRTLAVEWADRGVRVNSLAPAYLATEMTAGLLAHPHWSEELRGQTPMARFGEPEEVADCALFLASPLASYVTGATLFVDGGWTAR